jgi:hypothetical protein
VVIALAFTARAATVVCDPAEARRILVDANIDEARAPVTHPWLVPGLAVAAGEPRVAEVVRAICARGGDLSVEPADAWEDIGWAAYTLLVTSSERDACGLVHHHVSLSIGIRLGAPRYSLRAALPDERTPLASCDAPATWRSERVIDGEQSAVRLVVVEDHEGDAVRRHLVARRAGPGGWVDQELLDPAPPRVADPAAAGPLVRLAPTRTGEPWIVASQDRLLGPCSPLGGQQVWRWVGERWVRSEGRGALGLLAREGLWRYAGDDGWMLILAQDDEGDLDLLLPRVRRLQERVPEDLLEPLASADFPRLNPGFYVAVPVPWATEAEARAARSAWNIPPSYVKRAWAAVDPCGVR